jgi:hypothetical protein
VTADENGNVVKRTRRKGTDTHAIRRAEGRCLWCGVDAGRKALCDDCVARQYLQANRREKARRAKEKARIAAMDPRVEGELRPSTRAECPDGPCPWVGCRHHVAILSITETGKVVLAFPAVEEGDVDLLEETCSLRLAERGPHHFDAIARLTAGATSDKRTEQVYFDGLSKMQRRLRDSGLEALPGIVEARLARHNTKATNQIKHRELARKRAV